MDGKKEVRGEEEEERTEDEGGRSVRSFLLNSGRIYRRCSVFTGLATPPGHSLSVKYSKGNL